MRGAKEGERVVVVAVRRRRRRRSPRSFGRSGVVAARSFPVVLFLVLRCLIAFDRVGLVDSGAMMALYRL